MKQKKAKGFLVKMSDGTKYMLPLDYFIQKEVHDTLNNWNPIMIQTKEYKPATKDQAIEWAKSKLQNMHDDNDIEEIFQGIEWSDIAHIAIKLPTEPLSPKDMFEHAEIEMAY